MRWLIVSILTLSFIALSVSISFDTLTLFTLDLSSGKSNVFPICYLKAAFSDNFGVSLEDYITLSHETFSIGSLNIMKPRYYYLWYNGEKFAANFGKFKAKHYNTRIYELLRVGGIRTDVFGIDVSYKNKSLKIGGIYDLEDKKFCIYLDGKMKNLKGGIYYDGLHPEISADARINLKKFGDIETWLGISAKTSELASPSVLVGCSLKYGDFETKFQYVWKGSGYVDFVYGDPMRSAKKWAFYGDFDYNFGTFTLGAFVRYNSSIYTEGKKPILGLKVSLKDLVLKIGTGDLHSELSGDQNILLEWKGYVSIPIPIPKIGKMEKEKYLTPADVQKDENGDGKSDLEGQIVKVKGVVTVTPGVLGKNTSYIMWEDYGVMIYSPKGLDIEKGDLVIVEGRVKEYYGTTEIVVSNIKVLGKEEIKPLSIKIGDVGERFEGALVKIEGTVKSIGKYSFIVSDEVDSVKVYIKKGTNIKLKLKVGQKVKVIGIVQAYKGTWEILPRSLEDIQVIE